MSSEALERAPEQHTLEELHPAAYRCWKRLHAKLPPSNPRDHDDPSVNLDTLAAILHATLADRDTLLAEVARVEQERAALEMKFENANGSRLFQQRRADAAEAALAVAREREQRLREAVTAWDNSLSSYCDGPERDAVRAALVDEPAAATLAEPEKLKPSVSEATEREASHSQARCDSGSASAAADDGRCPGCGWYVADCNCVASAAADEPGETPA